MRGFLVILVASVVPMLSSASVSSHHVIGDPPVVDSKQLEIDQVFFVKGKVTLPAIGTIEVDLQVTTCKQGTSGCKPS